MTEGRKIALRSHSWCQQCKEEYIDDSEAGSSVRFFNRFQMPDFSADTMPFVYVIEGRVRLDQLAKQYYDDEALWWVIAAKNNIDLPDAELYQGQTLLIPSPDFVNGKLLRNLGR